MTSAKVVTLESIEQDQRERAEGPHTQSDSEIASAEIGELVEDARKSLIRGQEVVELAMGKIDTGTEIPVTTQPEDEASEVFVMRNVDMDAIRRGVANDAVREDWSQSRGAVDN